MTFLTSTKLLTFLTLLSLQSHTIALTLPHPLPDSEEALTKNTTTTITTTTNSTDAPPREGWECKELDYKVTFFNYHEPHFLKPRAHRFVARDLQDAFSDVHDLGPEYEFSHDGMTFRMATATATTANKNTSAVAAVAVARAAAVNVVDLDYFVLFAGIACLQQWIEAWTLDIRGGILSTEISVEDIGNPGEVVALGYWGGQS